MIRVQSYFSRYGDAGHVGTEVVLAFLEAKGVREGLQSLLGGLVEPGFASRLNNEDAIAEPSDC